MFFLILILLVLLILIVSPLILISFISSKSNTEHYGNCLLVIAHPDDECLFFAPTLLSLRSNIYLLCLSNGNNHRSDELTRSCQHLHIKDHRIIDDQIHLKDSQSVSWSPEAVLGHVKQAIDQWKISTLISFDQYGVSGHRNHSSIYYALLNLASSSPNRSLHFLSLQSLPIYRKYFILFEFLRFHFTNKSTNFRTFILPVNERLTPYRAMLEHRSQLVWFRYLYLLFSRYIYINDFRVIF